MADAGARRHDAEIVEGLLAPFQEGVALEVALVFPVHVHLEGARIAELVDHHAVVDHQIHRIERIDLLRITAEGLDAVAHRREIHHGRNAGKVLHQHPRRAVGDLARVLPTLLCPVGKRLDVVHGHREACILETQHVLENDLQRGRQLREISQTRSFGGGDGIIGVFGAIHLQGATGLRRVRSNFDGHVISRSLPVPILALLCRKKPCPARCLKKKEYRRIPN